MSWKAYLSAPVLAASFGAASLSCEDQQYTPALLDARPDITVLRSTDSGLGGAGQEKGCTCNCEDVVYQRIDEYAKSIGATLNLASEIDFVSLLVLYTNDLGVSFPDDTLNEFADKLAQVATSSQNIKSFRYTAGLLWLPEVQKAMASIAANGVYGWHAALTLADIAVQTRDKTAVKETARCLEAQVGRDDPNDLLNEFQGLALESLGYAKKIIDKARDCIRRTKE